MEIKKQKSRDRMIRRPGPADSTNLALTPLREIILEFSLACGALRRCIKAVISIGYPVASTKRQQIREDRTMGHRSYLVGAAMGLCACVAIASTPAMATPCTNLQSLQLPDNTINSAADNTTGVFVVPGSNPPATITGLPAFCRVTATLIPTSDSSIKIEVWLPETTWNGRFLGTGGGGFQGTIPYPEIAT